MTRFTCKHCGDIAGNCDCDLQIAAEERAAELVCEVCGLEPPYMDFDSCAKCWCAGVIAVGNVADARKHYGGAPWFEYLNRELTRQLEALRTLEVA